MNRPPADDNGRNFFHAIAAVGQVKLATRNVASVPRKVVLGGLTAKDKRGRTPLHHAAYTGHLRVLRIFADAAPEAMNIRDQDGNTVKDALRRPDASVVGDPANTRYFQRLVAIDKMGYTFNEFPFGPADVWDVAVSNTSTAVIVQPTWDSGERMLYTLSKGQMAPIDLGKGNIPRFVANSNLHTLVLTEDKCFAWGKNVNGILGLDTDGKTVHNPEPLDEEFVEHTRYFQQNAFSALGGTTKTEIKDPLIGVSCCDFHSACCSTSKVWAWGANRGQMVNKVSQNTIVETPMLVFQSSVRIRDIACTDNALVILLSNGHVMLLHNDRTLRLTLSKGNAEGEAITARGNYVAVQTNQGKLVRFSLNNPEEHTTIWTPRRSKDSILAFDMSENGAIIVATKSGIFKIEDARELTELKDIRGMQLMTLKSDGHFRSFVGVQQIIAGLDYGRGDTPILERYPEIRTRVRWSADDEPTAATGINLLVDGITLTTHRALLYARCPTLRPLINGQEDIVAVPGGLTVFRKQGSSVTVNKAPVKSVETFLNSLPLTLSENEELSAGDLLEPGPERHEFLALQRLITRELGKGLWEARLANVGCDVEIEKNIFAHSQVLANASPVLSAQMKRWKADSLLREISAPVLDQILRFAYTMELNLFPEALRPLSKAEQAQQLFELWQVSDELLMSCLSICCEQRLFEMLDFDLVVPLLTVTSGAHGTPLTRLRSSLLDIMSRYMDYFWQGFRDLDSDTMDVLEASLKALAGTEEPDKVLVDSCEDLRLLYQSSQPQSSKKKKPAASLSPPPTQPLSVLSPKSVSTVASPTLTAKNVSPGVTSETAKSEVPPPPAKDGGWIQARRKSRTSSQANQDKSGSVRSMLGSSLQARSSPTPLPTLGPVSSASVSPLPSSATASAFSSLNRNGTALSPSGSSTAKNVSIKPSTHKEPGANTVELPQLGKSSSGSDNNRLRNLPQLPTLGSQPVQRAESSGRGSRPKFNKKDRKKLQQFEDPFALVQQFESKNSPASSSTPWKQVTAASSQPVLERLERIHQINNKRTSKGSVWGV